MNVVSRTEPTTIEQACDIVRDAGATGRAALLSGARTKLPRAGGGPMSGDPPAVEVNTRRLSRVVELSPGDLTITVEAGMTLAALDEVLAPHGLRLPLDPPLYDGRATLGGVLAANDHGPLRQAHGTAREMVLGMSLVLADGALVKVGGKVVKNVAGYDLHRLMVGSHGSLGLIAAVSLRLAPRPESLRLVTLRPDSLEQAESWTAELLSGPTRPAILDWLSPAPQDWPAPDLPPADEPSAAPPLVVVGFEDSREAVDWQLQQATRRFAPSAAHDEELSRTLYERLRGRLVHRGGLMWRAALPSSRVVAGLRSVPHGARVHAHAGAGVIHGGARRDAVDALIRSQPASASQPSPAAARPDELDALRNVVRRSRGWMCVVNEAGVMLHDRSVAPTVDLLERRLKERLDPRGVFPTPAFLA